MTEATAIRLESWNVARRDFWEKLAPRCGYGGCVHAPNLWRRARRRSRGIRMQGEWYCQPECLESALTGVLRRTRPVLHPGASVSHRIPLGLILLSRQQLTAAQLRMTLKAQQTAGRGKIGEWLQALGFSTEGQVTAALARQWSCPVLRNGPEALCATGLPPIPLLLLESFHMIPVKFVEATATLLIAFSEGIDYTVLYAVEQMLECRTEPCLLCPSMLRKSLQSLAQHREASDIVFDRVGDADECARLVSNYAVKVRAQKVRLARCREYLWIRLERLRQEPINLVLRASADTTTGFPLYPATVAASAI
jgi:hypothetical protein